MKKLIWIVCNVIVMTSSSLYAKGRDDCFEVKDIVSNTKMYVNVCHLSSENISQFRELFNTNKSIVELSLSNIESDSGVKMELAQMLAENKTIKDLSLTGMNFTSFEIEQLALNHTFTSLTLNENHVDDRGMAALANNKTIKYLNLYYENAVTLGAILHFLDIHPVNGLGLGGYHLGDDGLQTLVQHVNTQQLIKLHIADSTITDISPIVELKKIEELHLLCQAIYDLGPIQFLHELKDLELYDCTIRNDGMAALSMLSNLQNLNLWGCKFKSDAATNFSTLSQLASVTIYSLRNGIGDSGLASMAKLPKLESIELFNQDITDKGAIAIAENHALKTLVIENNRITDRGAIALADAPSLQFLSLNQGSVGDMGGVVLAHRSNIKALGLQNNLLTDITANEFARFGENEYLIIGGNDFTPSAIAALKNNKKIAHLFLSGNNVRLKLGNQMTHFNSKGSSSQLSSR